MKKLIIILLILTPLTLFAQNYRAVIPVDSELYNLVDSLCYETGRAAAESARPWSAQEFKSFLSRIDYNKLSAAGKSAYDYIASEIAPSKVLLEEENLRFDLSLTLNPEFFTHAEIQDSQDLSETEYVWTHGYEERKSFIKAPFEFWYSDALYLLLQLELKEEYLTVDCPDASETADNQFNVVFDDPTIRIDTYFPFRAVSSAGGEWWDFFFGRDDLDWGNGHTGNLTISDYPDFYDFVMLKLWSESVTFSSVYITMEHSMPDNTASLISHRLDFAFFDNRLRFTIMESGALRESGWELLRDLNFLMIYHNWNTQDKVNSMMTLEASVNPWKWFNIYGQLAMDEFVTAYEGERDGGLGPSVFSYLAGAAGVVPLYDGYLNLNFEWVLTSPHMYTKPNPPYYYNTRTYWSFVTDSMVTVKKPTGYSWGPDSIVYCFDAQYSRPAHFSAGLNLSWITDGETPSDPITSWLPENGITPVGTPEQIFIMKLNGEYNPLPYLGLGADLYFINVNNSGHIPGAVRTDFEAAFNVVFELSADTF